MSKVSKANQRRTLGKVTSVTAERFVVELGSGADSFTLVGFDGQHYIARIGTFVLIPLQAEYVVAEVVGLREKEFAKNELLSSQIEDAHALHAIKFLDVVPIGTLPIRDGEQFRFGVSVFPPLYSDALYTQDEDLDRILEVTDAIENIVLTSATAILDDEQVSPPTSIKAFGIGSSVVFEDYEIKVRVDEFFGGHSAILGNTGSGKSCTVASIIQSIFSKIDPHPARGATFVFFDTNGEYRQALRELPSTVHRLYALVSADSSESPEFLIGENETSFGFRLPHWFLTYDEWDLLLQASEKAQRPVLRTALGLTSLFSNAQPSSSLDTVRNHVLASALLAIMLSSENATAADARIRSLLTVYSSKDITLEIIGPMMVLDYGKFADKGDELRDYCLSFIVPDIVLPDYDNLPFEFESLGEALDLAILHEESHGNRQVRDYCSSLLTRYHSIRYRREYTFMRVDPLKLEAHEVNREVFIEALLGLTRTGPEGKLIKKSQLLVLDMNEIEDEIVEVISTVVTRLIFERLRKAKERNALPVNLVLEEAHRYIADRPPTFAIDATRIFERVAKEGRKYGLFIMLASQRPSELSKTVLSQCSNFVVHRIQNPEDLAHIRQMTPFISESVLKRLPSLPKQHALIFGNSVNVPTTFRVKNADPKPRSDDARIREAWFVKENLEREL